MKMRAHLRKFNAQFALGFASLLIFVTGCSPIQSSSIGSLIKKESEMIMNAKNASTTFEDSSKTAIGAWEESVDDINRALQILRTEESKHALIFKSSQNMSPKTGAEMLMQRRTLSASYTLTIPRDLSERLWISLKRISKL